MGEGRTTSRSGEIERAGIDRRTLIKRAAAAGAVAWTAPIIIESLASPAAAQTGSCIVFRVNADDNCDHTSSDSNTNCKPDPSALCATFTTITNSTTPLSTWCMSFNVVCRGGFHAGPYDPDLAINIDPSCPCTFVRVTGRTNINNAGNSADTCFDAHIENGGKTARFDDLQLGDTVHGSSWSNFWVIIEC